MGAATLVTVLKLRGWAGRRRPPASGLAVGAATDWRVAMPALTRMVDALVVILY